MSMLGVWGVQDLESPKLEGLRGLIETNSAVSYNTSRGWVDGKSRFVIASAARQSQRIPLSLRLAEALSGAKVQRGNLNRLVSWGDCVVKGVQREFPLVGVWGCPPDSKIPQDWGIRGLIEIISADSGYMVFDRL